MALALALASLFVLIRISWDLLKIRFAVEKSAEIAEQEKAARAEHRAKTAADKEKEKRERKLTAAVQIVQSILQQIKGFKLKLQEHIISDTPDHLSVMFTYEYQEDRAKNRYVMIGVSPGPVSEVLISARRDKNFAGEAGETKKYVFPDQSLDAARYIADRLNQM